MLDRVLNTPQQMWFSTLFGACNCISYSEFYSIWRSQYSIFDFAKSNNSEIQKFQKFVEHNQSYCSFDIINIASHCKNFGVKQIVISGLTLICWNVSFIYQLSNSIKVLCQKYGYRFIGNTTYHLTDFRIFAKTDYI